MKTWIRTVITISMLLFTLGALLCFTFTIITGSTQKSVMKNFYWLQADTSSISTANYATSRWTNYGLCDASAHICSKNKAAYPFSPRDNFGSSATGIPDSFLNNRDTYYYLSRIGYGFQLVAYVFLVASMIPMWAFIITGYVWAIIAIILASIALFFILTSVVLSTAVYSKGKYAFVNNGIAAKLGASTMAVAWVSVFLMIVLVTYLIFLLCEERISSAQWSRNRRKRRTQADADWDLRRQQMIQQDQYVDSRGGVNFMHLIEQNELQNAGQANGTSRTAVAAGAASGAGGGALMNFFRIKKTSPVYNNTSGEHEELSDTITPGDMDETYMKEAEQTSINYENESMGVAEVGQLHNITEISEDPMDSGLYNITQHQSETKMTFNNQMAMNSQGELVKSYNQSDAALDNVSPQAETGIRDSMPESRNTLDPTVISSDIDDRYPGYRGSTADSAFLDMSEQVLYPSTQNRNTNRFSD